MRLFIVAKPAVTLTGQSNADVDNETVLHDDDEQEEEFSVSHLLGEANTLIFNVC